MEATQEAFFGNVYFTLPGLGLIRGGRWKYREATIFLRIHQRSLRRGFFRVCPRVGLLVMNPPDNDSSFGSRRATKKNRNAKGRPRSR